MLSVLVFLFMHSETELFDTHSEICKGTDLCLILDKASFENFHSINNFLKLSNDIFQISYFNLNLSYQKFSEMDLLTTSLFFTTPVHNLIKNQILLI